MRWLIRRQGGSAGEWSQLAEAFADLPHLALVLNQLGRLAPDLLVLLPGGVSDQPVAAPHGAVTRILPLAPVGDLLGQNAHLVLTVLQLALETQGELRLELVAKRDLPGPGELIGQLRGQELQLRRGETDLRSHTR